MIIEYAFLFAAISLLVSSVPFLIKSFKLVSAARIRYDEIDQNFDAVRASRKKLREVKVAYEALKGKYQKQRRRLVDHSELMNLYEVGSGSKDSIVLVENAKLESIAELEDQLTKVEFELASLIGQKKACTSEYKGKLTLGNSFAQANKFFNRDMKLRLRCLDKEFSLAKAVIDWNNVDRLKKRCRLVFREINEAGKLMKTKISGQYLDLRILQLSLLFRIANTKKKLKEAEREERAAERDAQREEERLKVDAKRAEKKRIQLEKLIAQEIEKLSKGSGDHLIKLQSLKSRLLELEEREKRTKAMSEITRSGYVYVISNTGSFGDGICKIGMTRRVEPMDRLRELGDASVPYEFDAHAFAYSKDAPALEKKLHDAFEDSRVNLVNRRREFFFIEPSKVIEKLKKLDPEVEIQTF